MPTHDAPRDARLMSTLLLAHGVKSYEPSVVHGLLELSQGFMEQVMRDARAYAEHAGRTEVDAEDVGLALDGRGERRGLERENMGRLVRERNAMPLMGWEAGIWGRREGLGVFGLGKRDLRDRRRREGGAGVERREGGNTKKLKEMGKERKESEKERYDVREREGVVGRKETDAAKGEGENKMKGSKGEEKDKAKAGQEKEQLSGMKEVKEGEKPSKKPVSEEIAKEASGGTKREDVAAGLERKTDIQGKLQGGGDVAFKRGEDKEVDAGGLKEEKGERGWKAAREKDKEA